MWNSPHRDVYLASLPLAGEDGTLDRRFSRTSAKGQIRAKTGTLDHVTALSGYATMQDGRTAAFSILVNNFSVASSYIRGLVDRIATAITQSRLETEPVLTSPAVTPVGVRE
jgi:D-alanyl-D-alanine carboxypeptidase/D-alanyl-D-alanine-endopeptidase (penicillin-binding protein 4)